MTSVNPPPDGTSPPQADVLIPPIGIWIGLVANGIAVCGGAVFLLIPYGRIRGMEPQAMFFVGCVLLSAVIGLLIVLPVSLIDLCRRHWKYGTWGVLLAFTPWPVAGIVAALAGWLVGVEFD